MDTLRTQNQKLEPKIPALVSYCFCIEFWWVCKDRTVDPLIKSHERIVVSSEELQTATVTIITQEPRGSNFSSGDIQESVPEAKISRFTPFPDWTSVANRALVGVRQKVACCERCSCQRFSWPAREAGFSQYRRRMVRCAELMRMNMPFNTDTASQDNIETHTVEQVKSAGPKKAGTASAPTKGRAAKREGKRKSQGAEVGKRSAQNLLQC